MPVPYRLETIPSTSTKSPSAAIWMQCILSGTSFKGFPITKSVNWLPSWFINHTCSPSLETSGASRQGAPKVIWTSKPSLSSFVRLLCPSWHGNDKRPALTSRRANGVFTLKPRTALRKAISTSLSGDMNRDVQLELRIFSSAPKTRSSL